MDSVEHFQWTLKHLELTLHALGAPRYLRYRSLFRSMTPEEKDEVIGKLRILKVALGILYVESSNLKRHEMETEDDEVCET